MAFKIFVMSNKLGFKNKNQSLKTKKHEFF